MNNSSPVPEACVALSFMLFIGANAYTHSGVHMVLLK